MTTTNLLTNKKQTNLGNKEDIFPKIRKKTVLAVVPSNCATRNSRGTKKIDKVHFNKLKSWIQSQLGNKSYY
jgi:hypothetical protein